MNSINHYQWHGHNIQVKATSSAKFLWLNTTLDLKIDDQDINYIVKRSLIKSSTNFALKHDGRQLKGQIISSGFPCTPIISQMTIVDDSILGTSQLLLGERFFTYFILSCLVIASQIV